MRFLVPFKTNKIPLNYRMMMLSIIKESLKQADEEYYWQFFELQKKEMKPFATAAFLRNFRIEEKIIHLDQLSMTISSPDQEFMLHLYNGILKKKKFQYRGTYLERQKIRLLQEKDICSDTVLFKTLSPILIESKEGKPVPPESSDYEHQVNYFADLILKNYRGKGLMKSLTVRPLTMTKQVIKESNQEFEDRLATEKLLYFTAYKGFLGLSGDPADLQLLYQLGLSKRRAQGFGLLEVEREEV